MRLTAYVLHLLLYMQLTVHIEIVSLSNPAPLLRMYGSGPGDLVLYLSAQLQQKGPCNSQASREQHGHCCQRAIYIIHYKRHAFHCRQAELSVTALMARCCMDFCLPFEAGERVDIHCC